MKKIGIICEYNPLHNGHVHHFMEAKKKSDTDLVILSLSGAFCQRGDLSILDKFTKTKLALEMGVDLVIENPVIFSLEEANRFAYYHVLNLVRAKVDEIWIGSEEADETLFAKYLEVIESVAFKECQASFLKEGFSLKLSFVKALEKFPVPAIKSNDMLGIFYLKALRDLNSNILLKTIKRKSSNYQENTFNATMFQSATAIRANISQANDFVPSYTLNALKTAFNEDMLLPLVKYQIILNQDLDNLLEASEGIENRLKLILNDTTFTDAISTLATKRYSNAKLKRLLINVLFHITKDTYNNSMFEYDFLRVLGFNEVGQSYLKELKKKIKIYTNIKEGINSIFDLELKISKILDLIYHTDLLMLEQSGPLTNNS